MITNAVKNRNVKAFYNHKCMQPNLYRIIWDLEMLIKKLTAEEKTKLTSTERMQKYKLCGGSDTLERFVLKIEEKHLAIQEDLSALAETIMTPEDLKAYNE
ncbi:18765_t:CDS:2, partial [Funneliformis geosporum]